MDKMRCSSAANKPGETFHGGGFYAVLDVEIVLGHVHFCVSSEGQYRLHGDALGLQLADEGVPAGVRRERPDARYRLYRGGEFVAEMRRVAGLVHAPARPEIGRAVLAQTRDHVAVGLGYRHITDTAGALSAAYEYRALDLFHRLADMYARAVGLDVPGLQRKQLLRAHPREEQQPYAVARLVVRQVLEQLSDFFRCEGVLFAFLRRVPRLVRELDRVLEYEVICLGLAHDLEHHAPALGRLRLVRTVLRKIAQEGLDVCGAYAPQRL